VHQVDQRLREIEQQRQAEHTDDGAAGAATGQAPAQIRPSVGGIQQREVDHGVQPAHERLVHLLATGLPRGRRRRRTPRSAAAGS
jgi:hypothetical protein